jgi:hypothetical protein
MPDSTPVIIATRVWLVIVSSPQYLPADTHFGSIRASPVMIHDLAATLQRARLDAAAELVERCGYGRRRPDLEFLERSSLLDGRQGTGVPLAGKMPALPAMKEALSCHLPTNYGHVPTSRRRIFR